MTVEPIRRRSNVLKIMNYLKHKNRRDYALFTVGVSVGLRGCDLLSMRWKDILDSDGDIKRKITIVESKTGKIKTIALGNKARSALKRLHNSNLHPNHFVFRSRQHIRENQETGLTVQQLSLLVKKWTKAVGIKGAYGSHTLRKTFAFHILKAGGDINQLMQLLNHSSPAITLRYAGIVQEDLDKLVLRLQW